MNESVVGMPVFLSGASEAVLTTGCTEPMFGQVTETVTPRVGYATSDPPSQAEAPVPAMFHWAVRVTVYLRPSMRSGWPAVPPDRGWGFTT